MAAQSQHSSPRRPGRAPWEHSSRARDERLRVIYDQAPVGIGEADLAGRIVAVNPRFCEIAGRSRDELLGRTFADITHAADRAADAELFRRLVAGDIPSYRRQKRYVRKDGQLQWVDLVVTLVRDPDGRPGYVVGVVQDITEQRRTEDALRMSQDLLDFALDSVSAAVWELDVPGNKHTLGPSYYSMLGYAKDEAPRDREGWLRLLHPDDRQALEAQEQQWGVGETGYREAELRIRARDGSWRWLLTRFRPVRVDEAGRPILLVGVDTDITARKHAELALQRERDRAQQYLDIAGAMIVVLDAAEQVVLVNRQAAAVLGLSEKEAVGQNWYDAFVPEDQRERERAEYRAFRSGERGSVQDIETTVLTRRGEVRIVAWHDTILHGDDGSIVGTISSGEDITERRRAEAAIVAARQQAEAANQAKSAFLARISHELRTPLNAILGFSDIIRREALGPLGSPRYKEFTEDIHSSGTHLLSLIDDLLDLSKIEAGRVELREEVVRLDELVDSVFRFLQQRAAEAGLAVGVEIPRDLPPVRADKRALKQVLLNLLSNAVKFTPRGGRITLRASRDPGGGLHVSVADNGIGIAAADIARAMEPFGQVDSSLTRSYEGAGLGLSISQRLVTLHGGRLVLESEPGVGTTITVEIPPERIIAA